MQALDPYDISKNISNNFYNANKSREDRSIIDKVLEQQRMGANPQYLQEGIAQILSRVSPDRQQLPLQYLQQAQANQVATQQKQEKALKTQDAFNRIVELVPKVGRWQNLKQFAGGGNRRESAEFESLMGHLESALTPIINPKGTMTDTRFKYIVKGLLPSASDTQEAIVGKLKGVADLLGINPAALGVQSQQKVNQVQENLFQGQKNVDFVQPNGNKVNVTSGNNQQILSALAQGYAPKGYTAMMATDGLPLMVPDEEVQNMIDEGNTVIYGH